MPKSKQLSDPVKVLFRRDRENGEVIAVFPYLAGTNDPYTCTIYVHNGQHSSAPLHAMINTTDPCASPLTDDLHKELVRIGYNLTVVKRVNRERALRAREVQVRC